MIARVMKTNGKNIILKTEIDAYLEVPKKDIEFDCKVGDYIEIDMDDGPMYFLPIEKDREISLKTKDKIDQKRKNSKNLKGIGGWLAFFVVTLVIGAIANFYTAIQSSQECATTSSFSRRYCNNIQPYLITNNIFVVSFAIVQTLLFILIVSRKKAAINLAVAYVITSSIYKIISGIVAYDIAKTSLPASVFDEYQIGTEVVAQTIAGIILLFWAIYFKRSERVARTLVE